MTGTPGALGGSAPGAGARAQSYSGGQPRGGQPGQYRWVYLWHWPIRAMHWAAALSIVALAVTGFYIGGPYFAPPATQHTPYFMGWIRLIHFSAAGVLVATGIIRVYWLFAGDKYERLAALFPVKKRDWVNLYRMVKYYLMIQPEKAPHYLGHNPLQQFSYTLIYLAALVMVITGFALYGQSNPSGLIYAIFGWVSPLLGGLQHVRVVHHVTTWVFLIFIPIHIYLAVRADVIERSGTITSIISGGRFASTEERYVDE
ncbi:MAG TPA: Ni/Fe-hydrogenase, b-type cytochrome subunit [Gemmatimonadaceae bacterium]|nr:Ni/Fe-hydrogenase, b-type cytochrome subunit [Gemmatimonadaceae bacterium]